jgi:hypothetical protein
VHRDDIAVGVGERERPPERAVERRRHDGDTVAGQVAVQPVDVIVGLQSQRHPPAKPAGRVQVHEGLADGERDRRGGEHDRSGTVSSLLRH